MKTLAYRDVTAPDFTLDQLPSDADIRQLQEVGQEPQAQPL